MVSAQNLVFQKKVDVKKWFVSAGKLKGGSSEAQ